MVKLFNSGLDGGFGASGPDAGRGGEAEQELQTLGQGSSAPMPESQSIFVCMISSTRAKKTTGKFIFHFGLTVLFER